MIEGFPEGLAWWHWYAAAAILAAVETFIPGAVAIWFAASAVAVGSLLLLFPVPWQLQLVLFGVLGLVAILLWRRLRQKAEDGVGEPLLNRRGAQYVGQVFTLSDAITSTGGKVIIGDTVWLARGPDAPAGAKVRVVAAEGAVLRVEPE